MAAASPQTAEGMEEDDHSRERRHKVAEADEEDEGLEITGARGAHEVERRETEVADRAEPKTGQVETCRHSAKGWCMRVDACRFAHPQPPAHAGAEERGYLRRCVWRSWKCNHTGPHHGESQSTERTKHG